MQANPNKSKQKGLFLFGGIGTFQRVTREKNKKFSLPLTRVLGCAQNPLELHSNLPSPRQARQAVQSILILEKI
jgi:hypothetical protein